MTATFRLMNLKLKRVSLVDSPANEHARVVLFKSKDGKERSKMDDDVTCSKCGKSASVAICPNCGAKMPAGKGKSMKDLDLSKITDEPTRKAVEKAIADAAADQKAAEELAAESEAKRVEAEKKLKAATPPPAKDPADVLKGLTPEAQEVVRKAQETAAAATAAAASAQADAKKANDAILKMDDERREREFIQKARAYGNLSVDPKTFGPVLKRVAEGTSNDKDVAEIQRVLAAANEVAKGLFRQRGNGNKAVAGGGASEEIQTKAKELRETVMKSGEKITLPEAMDRVIKAEPELYQRYLAEVAPTSRAAAGGGGGAPDQDEEE